MNIELYLAERTLVGKPLIDKLRDEILNSNGLVVVWTSNTKKIPTGHIISFEVGMAYSLGLPIYLFCINNDKTMPWFYDKTTDYITISDLNKPKIITEIQKIDFESLFHPVELNIPQVPDYSKPNSRDKLKNEAIVQSNNNLLLPEGFNGILQFSINNKRQKPEKNVRIALTFPECIKLQFTAGHMYDPNHVKRNEVFEMWEAPTGTICFYWPSLPINTITFELRMIANSPITRSNIKILISSDTIIGNREKLIPIKQISNSTN